MQVIADLLSIDGFITVNKLLIKKLGLHSAVLLGELCAEYSYWKNDNKLEDDMFYSTRENIEDNTGLNEHYQRKALAELKELGIITIKKKGLPAVNYYHINFEVLLGVLTTSREGREPLDINDLQINKNINNKNNKSSISKDIDDKKEKENMSKTKTPRVKKNLYSQCVALVDSYTQDRNLRKVLIEYLDLRIKMKDKQLYANMWKGMLNKLDELFNNDTALKIQSIKQSLERGYASFFPVNTKAIIKDKPWEKGVTCEQYTKEELAHEKQWADEMEKKGEPVWF